MHKAWLLAALACLSPASAVFAGEVDYLKRVKPILASRCFACHGVLKEESGLRLDAAGRIRQGGESGAAIVPGSSAESLLVEKITADEGERMPPEGAPLTADEIATIKAWIDGGAHAPDEKLPPSPREHWAFQQPHKPQLAAAPGVNPIDALLAAEQGAHGVKPLASAAPATLLRRVYLDLIGLPPTPEELRAFAADKSADSYEEVVDKLLADPRYGERWGRHWLDIWRYSDWSGLEGTLHTSQRHIWRWRDWVVESLNGDKPYDRMIVEMLAADEAAPGDRQAMRATGFLARNYYFFSRNMWLDGIVEHTSRGLLGLTLQCAKCHDHKYDPIKQEDYYQMRAFFEPHRVRTDRLPGQPDLMKDGQVFVYDDDQNTPTYLFTRGSEDDPDKSRPLAPGTPAIFGSQPGISPVSIPLETYYPSFRPFVREEMLASARQVAADATAEANRAQALLADLHLQVDHRLASNAPSGSEAEMFLVDRFTEARPEVWGKSLGDWRYNDGRLMQMQTSGPAARLVSLKDHPRDFTATLRFKIRGGDTRSVGMVFDSDAEGCTGVFLSPSNSKVQVYHILNGKQVYPDGAQKNLPVENEREYELKFSVEDRKLSVWVNGLLELVHQLGFRRTGKLALTSYQAAAEFLSLSVLALRGAGGAAAAPPAPMSQDELEAKLAETEETASLAEKKLASSKAQLTATRARIEAEIAKYAAASPSQAASLTDLQRKAAECERKACLATAEHADAAATSALAKLRKDQNAGGSPNVASNPTKADIAAAEGKLEAAKKELADAQAATQKAGDAYAALGTVYPKASTGRRLALARWIASPRNPLTARVAVNHIWTRHFGQPIVESMFDFGLRTKAPELRNVLDFLAVELVEHGWSMKHLHRLIVTSAAYRRQSMGGAGAEEQMKLDLDNHYYWCVQPKRMEGEVIRDSLLYMAGKLDPQLGGPDLPADLCDSTGRRTLYYRNSRDERIRLLTMFDAPNFDECYRRQSTIVPQQSLAIMNSRTSLALAGDVATRLAAQVGDPMMSGNGPFVTAAFETVLGREPSPEELGVCQAALERFKLLPGPPVDDAARLARARNQFVHVLVNHNDFITIR